MFWSAPRAELGIEGENTSATRSGLFWSTPRTMTRIEGEKTGSEDDIPEARNVVKSRSPTETATSMSRFETLMTMYRGSMDMMRI